MKDEAGTWQVYSRAPLEAGSTVWAVVPVVGASVRPIPAPTQDPLEFPGPVRSAVPTALVQVGAVLGAKYVLDEAEMNKLPQGTIVYVMRP